MIPMMLLGMMGRDDNSPKRLGEVLILDAARRVYRDENIAAWGLMLDCHGGPENTGLMKWYKETAGFTEAAHHPGRY